MLARCLRDKIPKGDYIIRASVLDRLTDNKMYYKIIEYGERVKEQRTIDKEKAKRVAEALAEQLEHANEDYSNLVDSKPEQPREDSDENERSAE